MTVYVYRDGKVVPKTAIARPARQLPLPMISRLEPYESPIDGHEVTSWGERDRELRDNDAYDPRDFSGEYPRSKGRKNPDERPEPDPEPELPFWTDPF